jgi:hypothetical protein
LVPALTAMFLEAGAWVGAKLATKEGISKRESFIVI